MLFAVACVAVAVRGESVANTDALSAVDSVKMYQLQELQVQGTRAKRAMPIAHSEMSQQQLRAINHGQDIPAVLSRMPGVTFTSDAGNAIGYTTLNVRGSDNTRVNITANGVPLNDAESSGLYWVNMGDFLSSAQDVQLQRGVGTSTNGSGAFGATINIQTEQIGTEPFVGLDLSGGSYYSHKETLRFGTGLLRGHWGLQGRLSNIGSKGYLDRASTKLDSYFLQAGYFSDNTSVKFITFNGQEETYHAWNYTSRYEQSLFGRTFNSCGAMRVLDKDGADLGAPDFTYGADDVAEALKAGGRIDYYRDQKDYYHQQHYQLHLTQRFGEALALQAALHYTRGDGYYEQYKADTKLYKYGLPGKSGDLINQKKMGNDFFGAVASLDYTGVRGLDLILGGGWNRYIGDHFGYITWMRNPTADYMPYMEYYRNRSRKNDGNIYLKATYELLPGLTAFADMQYRHVATRMHGPTDEFDKKTLAPTVFDEYHPYDFFNPKGGLTYRISNAHRVFASVAVSHKEPTRNDYEEHVGDQLKAERLTDWEAGYAYTSPRFTAAATLYYMNYADQFVLTGQLNDIGEPVKTNSGKSYRMGLELEAQWRPCQWFAWSANAAFSKSRNKDWCVTTTDPDTWEAGETVNLGNTPITFSPSTVINNAFDFKYRGFTATIENRYVGKQYLTNTGFESYTYDGHDVSMMLDDAFTTNLRLAYTLPQLPALGVKSATLGVTLYNVFAKKYDTNGWAYCELARDKAGRVYAWSDAMTEVGTAPAAPFNFMVDLSINF